MLLAREPTLQKLIFLALLVTLASCAGERSGAVREVGDDDSFQSGLLRCEHPSAPMSAAEFRQLDLEPLAGDYLISVIATSGFTGDSVVQGDLHLVVTPPRHREASRSGQTFPLYGWGDIDLLSLGRVSLAYSPGSRDVDRPGVQVLRDSVDGNLIMVLGAASTISSGTYWDAGVIFRVRYVDTLDILGEWVDGGNALVKPEGYFCARRISYHVH